jgi:NAD(P)-dependent dehydrogenase (short-subunit alcohol dehydrogenase family)
VLLVDRDVESALETETMIKGEGGESSVFQADVTRAAECEALVRACVDVYGRIDVLHNNVGIGTGDAGPVHLTEEAWDRIFDVNLKSMFLTCKQVLPVMREQASGCITNVSSAAAVAATGMLAYKTSKAGVNALTHSLAMGNAKYGIRVNAIMPGLMNTPMAIEGISQARGIPKEELIRARDARVPLGGKMGTAWDVAHAALFLASDEARFITGVILPVDGGQSARIG